MDRGGETQAATDPTLAQTIVDEEAAKDEAFGAPSGGTIENNRTVLLSVSWTFPAEHAVSQGQPDYLDGSCLVYAEERLIDVVDFRGAHSSAVGCHSQKASSATYEWSAGRGKAAAVLHSGDVMSADGGTHIIRVRLDDLPACATDCFFAISAYNCRNLSLFRSLNVRLLDADSPKHPLAKLVVGDVPPRASAILVCSLRRRLGLWHIRSHGRACEATVRDYAPIEATLAPMQDNHLRWRRRRVLVLASMLWQSGRATLVERGSDDKEEFDLIVPLLKLPTILFQYIVQFL
mmetsp:Transcript_117132/g.373043  ORF Transcript_117132/g.373043 Transcript_117132/m.373043 type:complete len:291 (-) Transcript_117132:306-1178(-)|eukprot:CAMPEP_0204238822 /NCGR_PEP_ID=MMETSP0361-20130328/94064_1 /ASSEMBLY_ACC=CAM_ASM_000343 /TAXON_ID=268821 /ORGANISM="Scrippsiella Hangoei, Strain SHTV-5" /LENGTH=290 /DNA_ID=CAMNT_0051211603 /DNA_START=91 /DNA_END=963 /DNA_ORIENTATION=-